MSVISRGPRSGQMNKRPPLVSEPHLKKATERTSLWLTKEDPGVALVSFVRSLITSSTSRLSDNTQYFSIYANEDFYSQFGGVNRQGDNDVAPVSDNQIRIQVDTTAGKLVQGNSRISMLTNGADYSLSRKASKCEAAIQGEWTQMGLYDHLQQVAKDGLICGDGYLHITRHPDGKRLKAERVYPNEIFVDNVECAGSDPTKLYRMRYRPRDVMMALYPDKAEILARASEATPPSFPWSLYSGGSVEIAEAWALPLGKRAGRHVIACSSGTILDEEYTHDLFPIVHFKPADYPVGWYGQGLVGQVAVAQQSLHQILAIMEEGASLATAPFWMVAQGANLDLKHLNNVPGHVIETAGSVEPKWITNAPFHQAAPVYCDLMRKIIKDQFGNNEMDTGGQLPVNRLDSKRALREYQDMASAHITLIIERWTKKLFVDCAKVTMALAQDVAKEHGSYPVLVQTAYNKAMTLDWKFFDLAANSYMLTPAPENLLPQTPSGKTQDLIEMTQAGLITQKQAQKALLGSKDANALMAEACAEDDDIDNLIEGFVEDQKYRAPSSLQDLGSGLIRVARARLQEQVRGAPPETLILFDRWLSQAEDVIQRQQQQPAPMPQGDPNGPAVQDSPVPPGGQPIALSLPAEPGPAVQPVQPPGQ